MLNRNKIRLAMVTTHPPGTGSLTEYAFHFVRALRQKPEIEELILLVDPAPAGESYPDWPNVRFETCWRFGALDNAQRITNAVKKYQPDGVLFNIQFASFGSGKVPATLGLMAPMRVKQAGFPTMVLLHNIMETVDLQGAGFGTNPVMEKVIRTAGTAVTRAVLGADYVALTIPKYVEILREKYDADNVLLAPHGSFKFDKDALEPSFELPSGPMQIMTFGKFGTYKKVEGLIEAYDKLARNGHPNIKLVIAGTNNPNAPTYLEDVREKYAHVANIEFTGYVAEEDVPRIFRDSAVVVFPYTSTTGSSGVLHQAGDFAKAVVLPNIGDFAEVITEEGYTGEFFQPNDVDSLASAIARLLDDPEHRNAIARQNYIASRGIPIENVVDWYLLHFQTLLKANSAHVSEVQ